MERTRWAIVAVAVLAVAVAVCQLVVGGLATYGQPNAAYDPGVAVGAAIHFAHGALPYRRFAFLQPPGLLLLLAPAGLLARVAGSHAALAAGQFLSAAAWAGAAVLAAVLLRSRGPITAVAAGLVVVAWPESSLIVTTIRPDPFMVCACLGGLALAFRSEPRPGPPGTASRVCPAGRSRLLCAGALLGLAVTVKLWAVAVLAGAVLGLGVCSLSAGWWLACGSSVGLAICAPFFAAAPGAFVRDVFLAQMGRRSPGYPTAPLERVVEILGLHGTGQLVESLALGLGLAATACIVFGLARAGRDPLAVTVGLVGVLSVAVLFVSPEFYNYYGFFPFTFGGLAALDGASGLLRRLAPLVRGVLRRTTTRAVTAMVAVAAIGLVGFGATLPPGTNGGSFRPPPGAPRAVALLAATVPRGACLVADVPFLAEAAGRFDADSRTCPDVVDPFGLALLDNRGDPPPLEAPFPRAYLERWTSILDRAGWVAFVAPRSPYLPWTAKSSAAFAHRFALVARIPGVIYIYRERRQHLAQ